MHRKHIFEDEESIECENDSGDENNISNEDVTLMEDIDAPIEDEILMEHVDGITLNEDAANGELTDMDDVEEENGEVDVEDENGEINFELGDELANEVEDVDSEECLFGEEDENGRSIQKMRNPDPKYLHKYYSMLMAEQTSLSVKIDKKQVMNLMAECMFDQTKKVAVTPQVPV